jgi:hypothetical protein
VSFVPAPVLDASGTDEELDGVMEWLSALRDELEQG